MRKMMLEVVVTTFTNKYKFHVDSMEHYGMDAYDGPADKPFIEGHDDINLGFSTPYFKGEVVMNYTVRPVIVEVI